MYSRGFDELRVQAELSGLDGQVMDSSVRRDLNLLMLWVAHLAGVARFCPEIVLCELAGG